MTVLAVRPDPARDPLDAALFTWVAAEAGLWLHGIGGKTSSMDLRHRHGLWGRLTPRVPVQVHRRDPARQPCGPLRPADPPLVVPPAVVGRVGLPPRADPAVQHVVEDPFPQRLAEAIASGVAERVSFPAGGLALLVERVRFRNGAEAVHKIVRLETEIDSEVQLSPTQDVPAPLKG